ncbi:ankyrin repeat domain-containing protein 26-like isoform X2 [Sciurus carolinensis]|nr:ankyrin repeat domain-containing protein 26-like isoform X2 [Sciurus carolinensis]
MEDLNNLSQSSETASKDFELADPNYEKILLLIEQHKTSCKDSVSLSEIKDAIISSQRTIEHKKCHCLHSVPLIEKLAKMENEVYELKMELLEAKKVKPKLQHEKAEWRHKLSNLICYVQEAITKTRDSDYVFKKINLLREGEGDHNTERELKGELEVLHTIRDRNLNTSRNKLFQVKFQISYFILTLIMIFV